MRLPENLVAFIYQIEFNNLAVEWEWIIDGELVDIIIDKPILYFNPPFLVEKYTAISAYNPTDLDIIVKTSLSGVTHRVLSIMDGIEEVEEEKPGDIEEVTVKELKESTAKGEILDKKIEVSDTVYMLYDGKNKGLNWTACDITNRGPNNVYFCINKWRRPEAPLTPGLTANIDLGERGAIKKIFFICDKGETATVYIRVLK